MHRAMPMHVGLRAFLLALTVAACEDRPHAALSAPDAGALEDESTTLPLALPDALANLPRGSEQLLSLCAHDGDDPIRSLFCVDAPPRIESIVDLQTALYIDEARLTGVNGLAIAGHSTSLGARSISSINPRVISVRIEHPLFDQNDNPVAPGSQGPISPAIEPVSIAFSRGEQFVELMVRDRVDHELRFYLLTFRQECNDDPDGCKPGDLLTPEVEKNWRDTSLYDERDLTNTVLDCAPCHQSNGPGTPKFLRMQELHTPWTHWFGLTEGGHALFDDYRAAKGDEPLAGLSAQRLMRANPVNLNLQATYGGPNTQPNPFDSQTIEDEVRASAAAGGGMQPQDNSIPGTSDTWRRGYETARRGEAITFPYHDVKVTDPAKLARATEAYQAYRNGELDRTQLPDIRDVFPDDPERLAEMGFMTKPGASGEEVLLEACSMCHNDRLDPSLSRARFRANLEGVTRAEKDLAIARLRLPRHDVHAMPPIRTRTLSEEARGRAIAALMR
jgi:mono/diheme cytochrome c family protein